MRGGENSPPGYREPAPQMPEKMGETLERHDTEARSDRRTLRGPLVVDVEVTDRQSGIQIKERSSDLSLYGCRVATAIPLPAGTHVMLKVTYKDEQMIAFGKVMYGRRDIGMGIAFTAIEPKSQKILEDWFAG
jgi:PilZ domain